MVGGVQIPPGYVLAGVKVDLESEFHGDERVLAAEIPDRDGILGSIRTFLGTGR